MRKITYRMYPSNPQSERLTQLHGLQQRLDNTALEERIRAYQDRGEPLNYHAQAKALTHWRS
ncbi:MAG: helix-turn-helix domain-containing protein [Gammaproteobacteria bacterium]|nr:helix-turn-helix domain-containing protein [Gammaproteobacteria bacterium]